MKLLKPNIARQKHAAIYNLQVKFKNMKLVKSILFLRFSIANILEKLKENYWISVHGSSRSPNIIMEGCLNFFCFRMYAVEKYFAETSNE
jgi:hypothetical protein